MASGAGREPYDDLTLLQERSAGTFSTVYVAESRSEGGLARIVAVKHLKEQWTGADEVLDRTRDEARLLSRLQHKNILRVEALISLKDRPAVVMEFVDGVDVKQLFNHLVERKLAFPPRAAYRIALSAASALDAAWNQIPYGATAPLRVVHRDVKPSNLMVSKEGELKVLDFGTARFNHEARVAHTSMMRFGSLRYMSPERKEGDRGDHPGDVYALGLLLIELLAGRKCKILPVELSAHDAAIASAIAAIDDVGLPDERWENTLFETLARMCAYEAKDRLTAAQCVPLLRAFADQARGDSLEALASKIVVPLANATYGRLGDGPSPSLEPIPTPDPEVVRDMPNLANQSVADQSVADPAAASVPVNVTTGRIAVAALAAAAPKAYQAGDAPTRKVPVGTSPPPSKAAPAVAAGPVVTTSVDLSAVPTPRPAPSGTAPQTASSNTRVLLLAGVAAFFLVGIVGAVALGIYTLTAGESSDATTVADGTTASGTTATGSDLLALTVGTSDSRVRWIKVFDADGNEVYKGNPEGSTSLSAGDYDLKLKITGRPAVRGTFTLDAETSWTCEPQEDQTAKCSSETGTLVLRPE